MLVAIDGDTVLYRAAFAAQRIHYIVYDTEEGMPIKEFKYKKEVDAYLSEHGDRFGDVHIEKEERVEPIAHALQNTKSMLTNIVKACEKFNKQGELELRVYMSGKNNFRKFITTYDVYKGNRPETKPIHYEAIKTYMEDYWDAEHSDHVEADDLMSVVAHTVGNNNCILVTTDKDLDQVPGWHFNFVKDSFYYVTDEEANKFFWHQMLIGDAADNVTGVKGCGPRGAESILSSCSTTDAYQQSVYKAFTDKYGEGEGHDRFIETYSLLRLLRTYPEIEHVSRNVPD